MWVQCMPFLHCPVFRCLYEKLLLKNTKRRKTGGVAIEKWILPPFFHIFNLINVSSIPLRLNYTLKEALINLVEFCELTRHQVLGVFFENGYSLRKKSQQRN